MTVGKIKFPVSCISGAYILILLELPLEEEMKVGKQSKTKDVDDAVDYLKSIFWIYANNQRFNFSRAEYHDKASFQCFSTTKSFINKFWHLTHRYFGKNWHFKSQNLFIKLTPGRVLVTGPKK